MIKLVSTVGLGQNGPGSNGNEGVFHIPPKLQDWSLLFRCSLVSYPGHSMVEGYPSAEMQMEYSRFSQLGYQFLVNES